MKKKKKKRGLTVTWSSTGSWAHSATTVLVGSEVGIPLLGLAVVALVAAVLAVVRVISSVFPRRAAFSLKAVARTAKRIVSRKIACMVAWISR